VTYFSLDNPAKSVQDFIKEFENKFKYKPNPVAAMAYDGTNLLIRAIQKVGLDKKKIMEELRSVKGYKGVAGLMETDKVGQCGQSSIIMQVKGGKTKVVWSSE
jgi:branched-chain amino acid transport system substrate-binding protein